MRRKSILTLVLLISVLIVSLPWISEALLVGTSDYTGHRTADLSDPNYGIIATGVWGDAAGGYFTVSWDIDYDLSYPKPYKYEYTFNAPAGGGLSHFIIEVSRDTTRDDYSPDPGDELKTHIEQQGNPNMPADLFGIKTNTSGQSGEQTYTIYSNRAPMWGDFYAKDGTGIYAYNTGFGSDPTTGTPSFTPWIAVPDTVIPEPGTLILMILGMLGLAGAGIKRKLNK